MISQNSVRLTIINSGIDPYFTTNSKTLDMQ